MQSSSVGGVGAAAPVVGAGQDSENPVPIASALLPEPPCCEMTPDSVTALASLLTQVDEQDRDSAREIEQNADQAATLEEGQRIEQMRQKADDDQSQAWASGLCGIVGGALTVGSAFISSSPANGSHADPNWAAAVQGTGKAAPDIGTIVAGGYKAAADRDDACAAHFDYQAQSDLRRYGEARDDFQSANESVQKVRQFLDQLLQIENATRLAAAGYRA